MTFCFVGYLPKNTQRPPTWSGPAHVQELCSVSNCIVAPPPGWIEQWCHNRLGFCDTQDQAVDLVPPGDPSFRILAFFLWERCFTREGAEPLTLEVRRVADPPW